MDSSNSFTLSLSFRGNYEKSNQSKLSYHKTESFLNCMRDYFPPSTDLAPVTLHSEEL